MKEEALELAQITHHYQILGVPFQATQKEVRHARNKLLSHFHPDRHPHGWVCDDTSPEDRVYLIQEAYKYITSHFEAIQKKILFLSDASLSNAMPAKTKSYWVYTTIAGYEKDPDERIK